MVPGVGEAVDGVGDVAAGEGGAADIFDLAVEFEVFGVVFAAELCFPRGVADLVAVGFAIDEDFHSFESAAGIEGEGHVDVFVFADDFVVDEPFTPGCFVGVEGGVVDAYAGGFANGFLLGLGEGDGDFL